MGKMSYFWHMANYWHILKFSSLWQCWQNKEDVATNNVVTSNFVGLQCSIYSHRFQYFLKFHSLKSPSRFPAVLKGGMKIYQYSQIREAIFKWRRKVILRDWVKKKKKKLKNRQLVKLERHCQLFLLKLNCCRAKTVGFSCLRLRSPTSWASTVTSSWF